MNGKSTIQREIIEVLDEGRATPRLLIDEIDGLETQQQAQYHLNQLRADNVVQKAHKGLYELDPS